MTKSFYLLPATFFFSGFCALVYQICWQRYLAAALGVDIDSTTIVVSVFMVGIGIGGALGGWLGDRLPRHRSLLYAVSELAIGAYALSSLAFFDWAVAPGGWMGSSEQWHNAAGGFVILLIPTVMMGMTLPLLTLIFNQKVANIGYSVGTLYFINTFGAAAGTLVTTFFLFDHLPLSRIVTIMAAVNFLIAAIAIYVFRKK
ncbi:MAG: fused MFS/spermidine synthase [Burkholderiaceae bacterium]|jgi:predicted membrane-bound spermidine synthase|nr:fused MFS/spermidine synthase [Burkholderiaceae bacterium]